MTENTDDILFGIHRTLKDMLDLNYKLHDYMIEKNNELWRIQKEMLKKHISLVDELDDLCEQV